MTPTITAFKASPDQGQGLARDMRVRWAFEEVGQTYHVRLVTFKEMKEPAHLAPQPFGQIPTYEDGDLALFETGAIILHIADGRPGLFGRDASDRARAITWMFGALNTIEPAIVEREQVEFTEADRPWYADRLPLIDDQIRARLRPLSAWLGDKDWLEDDFSAGDLMMVMVLRRAEGIGVLEDFPNLMAYKARGEARPAYRRAYAAQHAVFEAAKA